VHSIWNKDKKRAQLITDEFLGKITPDGFVEPKVKRMLHLFDRITVKEYGASFLLQHISSDLVEKLRNNFPEWRELEIKSIEYKFNTKQVLYNSVRGKSLGM